MSNAKEFSNRGITVNAICPGFIESDMTGELSPEYLVSCFVDNCTTFNDVMCSSITFHFYVSSNIQAKVTEGIPLKRLGKPEEVAGMCRFLAIDPAANYITGHVFNVDGGIAMGCQTFPY